MPRIRLIAGPNGSGKTTLMRTLVKNGIPVGQYINPDDMAKYIALPKHFSRTADALGDGAAELELPDGFADYFAAVVAQAIATGLREDWLDYGLSLTYESVMSHESHIHFVETATAAGFEPYLYYLCTSDPEINKERVKQRVVYGGHSVPEEKIESRYHRSLSLLSPMARKCKRVYFFDNSGSEQVHFAETTPDGFLDIFEKQFDQVNPTWFVEHLLKKWDKNKVRLASL